MSPASKLSGFLSSWQKEEERKCFENASEQNLRFDFSIFIKVYILFQQHRSWLGVLQMCQIC